MIRYLARVAAVVIVFAATVRAEELRTTTLFRTGTLTKNVGGANLIVRDVLGDSRPEIISCTSGSAFAMSYDGTTYHDSWYSPYNGCTAVAVGDRNGDGSNKVFVGTSAGIVNFNPVGPGYLYVYDAASYGTELAKVLVSATEAVNDIAVGNVDAGPGLEVVAVTNTTFFVFDAATLALKWSGAYGGHNLAIGDLEGDGINEIVIAGGTGYVIDTTARALKWSYPGGFGPKMALGDVDNDGKAEILCGTRTFTSDPVRIINGDTMTSFTIPVSAQSITAGDADNDGKIELITGSDQWGSVEGFSIAGTTATLLWSNGNPEHGVQGMAVGDPDGDGKNEILWGAGATSTGPDRLLIGTANVQTPKYASEDLDGPFRTAVGDLNGDGKLEIVVLSPSTGSTFQGPAAWVLDYATHRLIATLPIAYNLGASQVAIGQVDGDPAKEIIFLGSRISVFDGATFALEWSSPTFPLGPLPMSLIVRNIDGDPMDEILYANGSTFNVLNGASPFIQYSSPSLDSSITDFAVADLDGDSIPDLAVATQTGVYVFKTSDWSQRIYIPLANLNDRSIAATAGHLAFTLGANDLALYSGSTLTQEWMCSAGKPINDLAFMELAGQSRLAAAVLDSPSPTIHLYPTNGSSCPAYDTISGAGPVSQIAFTDVDGDGRPELLASSAATVAIIALGWNSEPRGDVNADGVVTDQDIDALAAYLYGNRTSIQPAADVNGDGAIHPDDLFYLINYRRGTDAPPPLSRPAPHSPGEAQ